jgi:hypothetical protein
MTQEEKAEIIRKGMELIKMKILEINQQRPDINDDNYEKWDKEHDKWISVLYLFSSL